MDIILTGCIYAFESFYFVFYELNVSWTSLDNGIRKFAPSIKNIEPRMQYQPRQIEQKWQQYWKEHGVYSVSNDSDRPKYYVLDMFPYPSGSGLHVGHPLGYIASDIISRYKRLKGYNVLHPMGFDAFGLPAEQYAINHGIHPAVSTDKNITRYKEQLENIGFSYDWSREVRTSDPSYYKWTQWMFLLLFDHYYDIEADKAMPMTDLINQFEAHGTSSVSAFRSTEEEYSAEAWKALSAKEQDDYLMNYRLAYRKVTYVNWCEELGTVLANDEVKDGVSERGGFPVERRPMLQWSLRITAYAERLLNDLEDLEWSSALKAMQRNWIGRSQGASVHFAVDGHDASIEVFTTRPDTIYGATFMVLAPEHPLVAQITSDDEKASVDAYLDYTKSRSERERQSEKEVSGTFTGAYGVNPVSGKKLPIYIAEYVLMDYGTGAIMAVPSDDARDFAFASHFGIEVIPVVDQSAYPNAERGDKVGTMINSDILNGLEVKEAIDKIISYIDDHGLGERRIQYKLRDANYSRQRYWGEPFPIFYSTDGVTHAVDMDDLPVELPELNDFKPATGAKSPLARLDHWVEMESGHRRETDTMPGFAGSSWYFLRYMDPDNTDAFAAKDALRYWQDVDLYVGGTEHAVGHLLYSRFWHKLLFDLGYVPTKEPFKKLVNQGMIQGRSNFIYRANESMAEAFFGQKLDEYHEDVQRNFPVGGIYVDFAIPEFKLAIEIKPAAKLKHLKEGVMERFEKEGWKFLGIPMEELGKYWNNFDLIIKKIHRAKKGEPIDPIRLDMEPTPVFVSKDRIHNPQHFTKLHVDIHLVKDDKLNIQEFMKRIPGMDNALFITNKHGEYVCGHAIEKMSKSKYNVINPDEVVDRYGADVFRMYEMFLGPIDQAKPWDTHGIDGVSKFLQRFWSMFFDGEAFALSDEEPTKAEMKILHQTLKKVEDDLERFSFNTCISQFMIATNELRKMNCRKKDVLMPLVVALAPFAPHITEELWHLAGHEGTVHDASFTAFDEKHLVEDEIEYPISVNGKKRANAALPADASKEDLEKLALELPEIQKWIEGKEIRKIIVVPKRMINIVV